MIVTHPLLFNIIVVLFIAFTSAWLGFVINGRAALKLKNQITELENEKEFSCRKILELEEKLQRQPGHGLNNTPVIPFSSSPARANKTN